jgi:ABC-type glycerol-3-phosphate transport system permease component
MAVDSARRARIDRRILVVGQIVGKIVLHILVATGALFFTIPFAWMVSTSLKQGGLVMRMPPVWIPPKLIWSNYTIPWTMESFSIFYRNTAIICTLCLAGTMISSTLVAYAFARLRFPGRGVLFLTVLASLMLPGQVTLIPTYVLFSKLDWVDTWLPLVVPTSLGSAFHIFLLRQYFMTISRELDDAAKIDGCTLLGIFFRIILPLSRPALGVVGIYELMYWWNNFFTPLIYLNRPEVMTLSIGLRMFQTRDEGHLEWTMAMTVVSVIPMMAVFFVAQRHFIQGIVLTGIKG